MRSMILLFLAVLLFPVISEAEVARLSKSRLSTVSVSGKTVTCALFPNRSKWSVAKRVRGRGSVYKRIRGTSAQRTACRTTGSLGTVSLATLPSTDSLIRENASSAGVGISAVSGTPPLLPDIPSMETKNLFWRSGVIDAINGGSPSNQQCSELFSSVTDGESGGMNACYLTQNVGYSFGEVLRSGTTLCYMKNAATQAILDSGALGLVSGSFPSGDVEQLFSAPSGTATRTVMIDAPSDEGSSRIYIRVYGSATNAANGDTYRFNYWSCDGTPATLSEYETTRILTTGQYISTNSNSGGEGAGQSTVQAFLRRDGDDLVFDNTRDRSLETTFSASGQDTKTSLTIDSNNLILSKSYFVLTGENIKSYSVSRVSGSSVATLRFLEGAYKDIFQRSPYGPENRVAGIEYRDSYYANAPASSYVADLSAVNLSTDTFYSSITPATFDTSAFSCSTVADVELTLDLASAAMTNVRSLCEGTRLDGMNFCSSTDVFNAYANYNAYCPI